MRVKAKQDFAQAALLIDYLAKNDAELLNETWVGLLSQGPGWRSRAIEGRKALKEHYPGVDTDASVDGPHLSHSGELTRATGSAGLSQ